MPRYDNYFDNDGILPVHKKRNLQEYRLLTIQISIVKKCTLIYT